MPLYEYQCDACGKRFEHIAQKFSDPPAEICELCGKGPVRRLLSSPAIQFKGSGFYITDYAKKSSPDTASKSESSESSAKSDTGGSGGTGESKAASSDTKSSSSETKSTPSETKSSSSSDGASSSAKKDS